MAVNVGRCRALNVSGRAVSSAIGKSSVDGSVAVREFGLEGDEQADKRLHGGRSKAVYAYSWEAYEFWRERLSEQGIGLWADDLAPGRMGENLTITGLSERDLWLGDRLVMKECVLEVSESRTPCSKFTASIGWKGAAAAMTSSGLCGAYLRVVEAGSVMAGDHVVIERGPKQMSVLEHFQRAMRQKVAAT